MISDNYVTGDNLYLRELQNFFFEVLGMMSITHYGAVGDGRVDNYGPLQVAIDDAHRRGLSFLYVPYGRFIYTGELINLDGIIFMGNPNSHIVNIRTGEEIRIYQFGWLGDVYYSKSEADGRFVNITGDTMTGSLAIGGDCDASGSLSFAQGEGAKAIGIGSHAEGYKTQASAYHTHAEGYLSKATADQSHAEGHNTTASAWFAHAEGYDNVASGQAAHAEGYTNTAGGSNSHAEGRNNTVSGVSGHVEGGYNTCSGYGTHVEGVANSATGNQSHAEGYQSQAPGPGAHAEGGSTIASGNFSHTEGHDTTASGTYTHAEGYKTIASGWAAHAEGHTTSAGAQAAHAEGVHTTASGTQSHAEGNYTTASGVDAHAEGRSSTASGIMSHAEGHQSTASGQASHAEGYSTTASGQNSHAGGHFSVASGMDSFAHGHRVEASRNAQFVTGVGNVIESGEPNSYENTTGMLIVGNGTRAGDGTITTRSNAMKLTFAGDLYVAGSVTPNGADYAECVEWLDGNPNNDDRVGKFVVLEENKMRLATSQDSKELMGVVSAKPTVLGDAFDSYWHGKYVTDVYGRIQYETADGIEKPIISPDYNPELEYVSRVQRKEYGCFAMLGKLIVEDDGTCEVGGYCFPNDSGIATKKYEGYYVMERIDENHIRIFVR